MKILTTYLSALFFIVTLFSPITSFAKKSDYQVKTIPILNEKHFIIAAPKTWEIIFNEKGQTVKLYSQNPNDPVSLIFTLLPNKNNNKLSKEDRKDIVRKMAQRYASTSIEKKVNLYSIDTSIGPAIFASFNEKKYENINPMPKGKYSSITIGMASHSTIIIAITILSNGINTKELAMAKNLIKTFITTSKDLTKK